MTFYILSGNIVESSVIGLGIPNITSADRINSTSGSAFSYTITATQSPFAFACDWLPYGLSINETTGVISGIVFPNSVGEYRITLKAANAIGVGSMVLTIDVPAVNYLLTASTYAILGDTAITNTGNTVLHGNLGLYPGTSVTGFPPGIVNGIENIANAAALQAHTDATAGAAALLALTPTTDISSTDLGGYIALPGNYNATSTGTWSAGPLTLNAMGNPNAQFVFTFGTGLTLPAGASVVLENGAKASNVYFVTGTTFTFGANNTVNGTILAGTSITFASNSVLNGRALVYGPSGTTITFPSAGTVTVPS